MMIYIYILSRGARGIPHPSAAAKADKTEKLIELYEDVERLWYSTFKAYHNKGQRAEAIKKIAMVLEWSSKS